jgi:exodeoxyribonuclease VII small subunit
MSSPKNAESLSFEQSMQELEAIVQQMEQGELPLEQALEKFERGIQLARQSQQRLQQAEQKVQILMRQNGQDSLQDLDTDTES